MKHLPFVPQLQQMTAPKAPRSMMLAGPPEEWFATGMTMGEWLISRCVDRSIYLRFLQVFERMLVKLQADDSSLRAENLGFCRRRGKAYLFNGKKVRPYLLEIMLPYNDKVVFEARVNQDDLIVSIQISSANPELTQAMRSNKKDH